MLQKSFDLSPSHKNKIDQNTSSISVCGVDESGRGCWAGSVFAAAVILPKDWHSNTAFSKLNDSKKLSPLQRERLFSVIEQEAHFCIASASAAEIDQWNILKASLIAMNRALSGLSRLITDKKTLTESTPLPDVIYIDGLHRPTIPNLFHNIPIAALIKADATIPAVSAASILAKVARDRYCQTLHHRYPDYGFDQHKGYGTALHDRQLKKLGPTPEHRASFKPVKDLIECQYQNTKQKACDNFLS